MFFSPLPEKQNQGVAGLCQVEIELSALLLINSGLEHVAQVCEQVGFLNFTPRLARLTYQARHGRTSLSGRPASQVREEPDTSALQVGIVDPKVGGGRKREADGAVFLLPAHQLQLLLPQAVRGRAGIGIAPLLGLPPCACVKLRDRSYTCNIFPKKSRQFQILCKNFLCLLNLADLYT